MISVRIYFAFIVHHTYSIIILLSLCYLD